MINIVEDWGISDDPDTAGQNSQSFNSKIKSGQTLYLPGSPNPYPFDVVSIKDVDNVEFYGDSDTVIKFSDGHTHLEIVNADNFNIHDLKFDGRESDFEGGVWAKGGSTNGTLKNLEIRDAFAVSCVIEGQGTHDVTVEDCTVYGQRHWSGNAKAMFLAGGYAQDITFINCRTYSAGYYSNTGYSPADHFDSDNGLNITYQNCYADGEGSSQGVGFWNEADPGTQQETSSYYYNCTAYKTKGGLGSAQNSYAEAHNMDFIECSGSGWAAWSHGSEASLEIYNSTFDDCYSYYAHYRGGGVVIDGAATIDNCEFINTQNGYNITLYTPDENNNKTVTIENNTFDRDIRGYNASEGTGDVYVRYNNLASGTEIIQGGDYDWHVSGNTWGAGQESATTSAINSPTSSTTVSVEYQSHFTSVQYNSGESIRWMLVKMVDAINSDSGAYITADYKIDSITFTQKDAGSTDNQVSIYINNSAWGNGPPFNPMNPTMS